MSSWSTTVLPTAIGAGLGIASERVMSGLISSQWIRLSIYVGVLLIYVWWRWYRPARRIP